MGGKELERRRGGRGRWCVQVASLCPRKVLEEALYKQRFLLSKAFWLSLVVHAPKVGLDK